MTLESLITDRSQLRALLEGSWVTSEESTTSDLFAAWELSRRFIADAIPGPGSFLDYGCANGLLLRCLMEWSVHTIEPFGIDIDAGLIDAARDLFPGRHDQFFVVDEHSDPSREVSGTFDHVYWAVGDNVDFDCVENIRWLSSVERMVAPRGRLMLGFYAGPVENRKKIASLSRRQIAVEYEVQNPCSESEAVAVIDVDRDSRSHG